MHAATSGTSAPLCCVCSFELTSRFTSPPRRVSPRSAPEKKRRLCSRRRLLVPPRCSSSVSLRRAARRRSPGLPPYLPSLPAGRGGRGAPRFLAGPASRRGSAAPFWGAAEPRRRAPAAAPPPATALGGAGWSYAPAGTGASAVPCSRRRGLAGPARPPGARRSPLTRG